jgi:hypothetical protein
MFLLGLIAAIGLPACEGSSDSKTNQSSQQAPLNSNRALWRSWALLDYQFTYRMQCFCMSDEVVITVSNGLVTQAFRTRDGTFLSAQERTNLPTIEVLFDKVQEAINQRVYSLTVIYNAQRGYPESIQIDNIKNAIDDEVGYLASNLQ